VRVVEVAEPRVLQPRDAVLRVRKAAICGSDLHMYDGYLPTMEPGDILGHEFVGDVVDVGSEAGELRVGDRVVVPFPISCGRCWFCEHGLYALCDASNPNAAIPRVAYGYSPAGIFGYSHAFGGFAGGQADYVRVPYADVGPAKVPDAVDDEQAVMLSDVMPTGWQAAEACDIQPGDAIAVWGAGPVGLMAVAAARHLGAELVVAIDRYPERLYRAERLGARTIDYTRQDVFEELKDLTSGRGPDACIDAVGMEGHGTGPAYLYDRAKQALRLETDRPTALRQALHACRKGGIVSVPGVYGGFIDKFPMGEIVNKGLTLKSGQTNVQRYLKPLLDVVARGEIDPALVVSHRMPLDRAPAGYRLLREKADEAVKVVLTP